VADRKFPQTLAFNDYNDDKAIIDAGGVPILLAALAPESHGENKRTRVDLQVRPRVLYELLVLSLLQFLLSTA
jgi:hypothetical protein